MSEYIFEQLLELITPSLPILCRKKPYIPLFEFLECVTSSRVLFELLCAPCPPFLRVPTVLLQILVTCVHGSKRPHSLCRHTLLLFAIFEHG